LGPGDSSRRKVGGNLVDKSGGVLGSEESIKEQGLGEGKICQMGWEEPKRLRKRVRGAQEGGRNVSKKKECRDFTYLAGVKKGRGAGKIRSKEKVQRRQEKGKSTKKETSGQEDKVDTGFSNL